MTPLAELLGESPGIQAVRHTVGRLLAHGAEGRRLPPILILGETGTGKGLLARALRRAGPRAKGPLVEVNCAAIPETLLEAELFGFERGAFTDARQPKAGLFQTAHGGTLFLDEIGLLPERAQAKLLKVLEDGTVRRLGSTQGEPADVAIVAATSEDLLDAVRVRRFREDLYHRLAVVTVRLPPLAERGADILLLAEHFLARACVDYRVGPKTLTPDAKAVLLGYRWPGNIRELANVMERAALLTETSFVSADALDLPAMPGLAGTVRADPRERTPVLRGAMETVERERVLEALGETDWNIARAAARLQVPRGTLRYRIEKLGLRQSKVPSTRAAPRRVPPSPEPATIPLPHVGPGRGALSWERRWLAFARVAVIPPPARGVDAEIARTLEVLVEKVESFGGRIEEVGPRSVVAVFGLEPVEDAPRRAAHAAVAMRKAAERARFASDTRIETAWAIHVSQGFVGQTGEAAVIDAAAKGQAYAVLETLVTGADPDVILVSPAAARTLERRFALVPVSLESPGGQGYRLEGLEQPGLASRGSMTPFVGRESELEQVRHALDRTAAGHGQLVALVGEPGVGKSRLVWEVMQAPRRQGWRIGHASALSYGHARSYGPVIDLLRADFQIEDRDDPREIREKVRGRLLALDPALVPSLPVFLALLDIPLDDGVGQALEPPQHRQRTLDAVKGLWLREAQIQPMLLVVEDLHWVDTETQALLDNLIASLPAARLCLLVDYRPEYQHGWGSTSYTQLRLDPLSPESARELLELLLGKDRELEPLTTLLIERTDGNPFFLEETVQTLVETQALGGERGARSLARPIDGIEVPTTVEAVLAARIDRLPSQTKCLLQAASVIGKDVPVAVLRVIAEASEDVMQHGLATLRAAELLHEARLGPDLDYTFKHALTHEVAYGGVPHDRRRALHSRIVQAIEALQPDRLGEEVDRLAHHAVRGEVWDKAVTYLEAAGIRAIERLAYREASARLHEALATLARLPDTRERVTQEIAIRVELPMALARHGDFRHVLDHLNLARDLAESLGDRRRLGQVSASIALSLYLLGQHEQALAAAREALTIGISEQDVWLQAQARLYLAKPHHAMGDYGLATCAMRDNMAMLDYDLGPERSGVDHYISLPSVSSRVWLSYCLVEQGKFEEGIAHAREGVAIAKRLGHPWSEVAALHGLAYSQLLRGDHEIATPLLARGLTLAREREVLLWEPDFACGLGYGYVLGGRAADAVPLMEPSIRQQEMIGAENILALFMSWLGEAYLQVDRLADASRITCRALALARERKQRSIQALCHRLEAEVTMRLKPFDPGTAERHYREALGLATQLGMRPLVAHCHLGLGTLYRRTPAGARAREHLTTATTMYREMEMAFWLVQAERETKELA